MDHSAEMSATSSTALEELQRLLSVMSTGEILEAQQYVSQKLQPEHLQAWNQTASPLLRLPRELRDQILADALVDRYDIEVPCPEETKERGSEPYLPPALLYASHQLRQEAAEVYYADNTFGAGSDTVYKWLPSLPVEHRKLIKTVRCTASCRVHWWHHDRAKAVEITAKIESELQMPQGSVWAEIEMKDCGSQVWLNSQGRQHEV
ncbi:hypothetical protein LTR65_010924 [Meristemomyces frigidus]